MEKVQRKNWFWCLHCERVFKSELEEWQVTECPFDDCDGGMADIKEWKHLREINKDFPEVPEGSGMRYRLYSK
jgi:Zn finger protein HypA/HybF involved in hydrogenase expression